MRKRQPGPKPKYFRTGGHQSSRCSTCTGTKNPGSLQSSSPAQMYQPVVSPSGGWRSPLIGSKPVLTFLAMPTFKVGNTSKNGAPCFWQSFFCSFNNCLFKTQSLSHFQREHPQKKRSIPSMLYSLPAHA